MHFTTIIDKKLNSGIKTDIIKELIKRKPKSIKEIKKAFKRIDSITLFNGRVIEGAIISRGKVFKVLTTDGVIKVREDQIKNVKVIK